MKAEKTGFWQKRSWTFKTLSIFMVINFIITVIINSRYIMFTDLPAAAGGACPGWCAEASSYPRPFGAV